MDRDLLEKKYSDLDVTRKDIRAMKLAKFKEKWIYPVTGAIVFFLSALIGYFWGYHHGQDKPEKLMNRETGRTYPYNYQETTISNFFGIFSIFSGILAGGGILSAVRIFRAYPKGKERTYRLLAVFTIAITSLFLFIAVFWKTYHGVEQPVEYYSGAIDYGVYSRDETLKEGIK